MAAYPSNGTSLSAMFIYLYQKDSVNRTDMQGHLGEGCDVFPPLTEAGLNLDCVESPNP